MNPGLVVRRKIRSVERKLREVKMVARGLKSNRHPILVHLVPIRRCNLSCTYCNEFDNVSKPVPKEELMHRVDLLAALGSENIHISGGEPLLHPDIEEIIAYISVKGISSGLLTNGYLLSPNRIQKLNAAGLDYLQISIDNVSPDETSMKSLKVLDQKLKWLSELAEFSVSINSVLGADLKQPEDALSVTARANELGLQSTVGIIHDQSGQVRPLGLQHKSVYERLQNQSKKSFLQFAYYQQFQNRLVEGKPNDWHCGAGARYLYICEDGLVHYCSQQRGTPGIPLEQYTAIDLEREYKKTKPCAPHCTISCVHRVAMIDRVREKPVDALKTFFPPKPGQNDRSGMPYGVRFLVWLFLPEGQGKGRRMIGRAAKKMLGVG
jgi:MoaA/NifB/PqqE/SkfB family radical SAM enzyme